MNDYSQMTVLMERIIHKYNQWENRKRTYGTKMLLTRSEINTIAAVGDNPGINITALASALGVTKAAASQMIYKLVDKGVVEKAVSPYSDTEVVLNLTEEGQKNYIAHRDIHTRSDEESLRLIQEMPEPFCREMIQFLTAFEEIMDKRLKEE